MYLHCTISIIGHIFVILPLKREDNYLRFLAHMGRRLKVSYCDQSLSVVPLSIHRPAAICKLFL